MNCCLFSHRHCPPLLIWSVAALSWLGSRGIGGAAGPRARFAEAFCFSVQTLGSIGYGVLQPLGLCSNLLLTAESLCGLLFVVIITGPAFACFAPSQDCFKPLLAVDAISREGRRLWRLKPRLLQREAGLAFLLVERSCIASMPPVRGRASALLI